MAHVAEGVAGDRHHTVGRRTIGRWAVLRAPLAALLLVQSMFLGGRGEAAAQMVDTAAVASALSTFAVHCHEHGAVIWGRSLCGPLVMVHAPTRTAVANAPDPEGAFVQRNGVWIGTLPAGMPTANTAVTWQDTRWAMVLLPLPADEFERAALLAHEAFHRVQPELGLSARDAQNPHLDLELGRLWLRMELRALAAGLRAEEGDTTAVRDALHFRAHRHRLFPGADTLEAMLEQQEGLAEYTGAVFARSVLGSDDAPVLRMLERFEGRRSYVRALGYGTGPALGMLLDRYAGGWRAHAGEQPMAVLLARAVGFHAAGVGAEADLLTRAARYGHAQVAREESERAVAAAALQADIRARLLEGPVLVLRQGELRASFNPNELVPVPEHGTYYPSGTFEAGWGRLVVTERGALLSPDWQTVRVPAPARLDAGGRALLGDGWQLEFAAGWTARPGAGGGWLLVRGK